jgi:hypothetical protein
MPLLTQIKLFHEFWNIVYKLERIPGTHLKIYRGVLSMLTAIFLVGVETSRSASLMKLITGNFLSTINYYFLQLLSCSF